jgi:large subunit ribosomal protein L16
MVKFVVPRKKKYKKYFLIKYKNQNKYSYLKFIKNKNNDNNIDTVYLVATKTCNFKLNYFELCLKILKKKLKNFKKKMQIQFYKYPNLGITKKPRDTRMGRGKGNVVYYVDIIKKGSILVNIHNVPIKETINAYMLCIKKFPKVLKILRIKND